VRILCTSDWHLDAFTAGLARFDDVARSARGTVELAKRERCDGYVFLGDLADPGPRAHRASALAIELASDLARAGIWSRWLVGNHDVVEDGSGSSTLSPLAAAAWNRGEIGDLDAVRVWPGASSETWPDHVLAIGLPHPARGMGYSPDLFVRSLADAFDAEEVAGRWCPRLALIFGHLTVPGIEPGSETREMPRGREVRYPVEAIRERWGERAVMLNGHYHRSYRRAESPVIVPGSLERLTKGEARNEPGCLILEV